MNVSKDWNSKLFKIVQAKIMPIMRQASLDMIDHAIASYEAGALTGNTLTSYTAGIYENNNLVNIVNVYDVSGLDSPRYEMLDPSDGTVTIQRYDDGRWVSVSTEEFIPTGGGYGSEVAEEFLRSYSPSNKKGWSVVVTTGTPYSDYLEESRGLNILMETFLDAKSIIGKYLS